VLGDAGLVGIGAEVHMAVVAGGSETWTPKTVEHLADRLMGTELVAAGDLERFLALTADPSCHYTVPFVVTAWGQRPG
jgi:hypothetical protein